MFLLHYILREPWSLDVRFGKRQAEEIFMSGINVVEFGRLFEIV